MEKIFEENNKLEKVNQASFCISPQDLPKEMDLLDFYIKLAQNLDPEFNQNREQLEEYKERISDMSLGLGPFNLKMNLDIITASISDPMDRVNSQILKLAIKATKDGLIFNIREELEKYKEK